jgi:hypothetical protein
MMPSDREGEEGGADGEEERVRERRRDLGAKRLVGSADAGIVDNFPSPTALTESLLTKSFRSYPTVLNHRT